MVFHLTANLFLQIMVLLISNISLQNRYSKCFTVNSYLYSKPKNFPLWMFSRIWHLRGQPCAVVLHCLSRMRKAGKFRAELIKSTNKDASHFKVNSLSGKQHEVEISNGSGYPECTCRLDTLASTLHCSKYLFVILPLKNGSGLIYQAFSFKMNTFVLIINSALVEDDDYAFLPNCEVDNSQVCNMEDVAEYSHDLYKCKVSGSTSSQIAFMHTYHSYLQHATCFCAKNTEEGIH